MKTLFPIKANKILLKPFTIEEHAAKNRIDKVCDIREHLGCQSNLENLGSSLLLALAT
ncbi:MAG: hypothetical protein U9R02_04315 [Thermodesulfobacteriota bacterium]|nr:hypothetical protein [Thermodesulfobacteriota bacterium]